MLNRTTMGRSIGERAVRYPFAAQRHTQGIGINNKLALMFQIGNRPEKVSAQVQRTFATESS